MSSQSDDGRFTHERFDGRFEQLYLMCGHIKRAIDKTLNFVAQVQCHDIVLVSLRCVIESAIDTGPLYDIMSLYMTFSVHVRTWHCGVGN